MNNEISGMMYSWSGSGYDFYTVFRIRNQLNSGPDPAKNLNPDPDPEDLESGSGSKLFLMHDVAFRKI